MGKPIPVIDLGAKFQVIDETSGCPKWKTIATGSPSESEAIRVCKKHNLRGVWINDGFDRRYVNA